MAISACPVACAMAQPPFGGDATGGANEQADRMHASAVIDRPLNGAGLLSMSLRE